MREKRVMAIEIQYGGITEQCTPALVVSVTCFRTSGSCQKGD